MHAHIYSFYFYLYLMSHQKNYKAFFFLRRNLASEIISLVDARRNTNQSIRRRMVEATMMIIKNEN